MTWLKDNIKAYLYESTHNNDYTVEEMTDDILQIIDEYREDYSKYRWHDLRENPDDLPEADGQYSGWVVVRLAEHYGLWFKAHYDYNRESWECVEASLQWNILGNPLVLYPVIAWREIEPFGED